MHMWCFLYLSWEFYESSKWNFSGFGCIFENHITQVAILLTLELCQEHGPRTAGSMSMVRSASPSRSSAPTAIVLHPCSSPAVCPYKLKVFLLRLSSFSVASFSWLAFLCNVWFTVLSGSLKASIICKYVWLMYIYLVMFILGVPCPNWYAVVLYSLDVVSYPVRNVNLAL